MSVSINEYSCAGNLVRDIEIRTLDSGTTIANSAVAINERVKRGGEWEEDTIFMDFTVFGKQAELCAKHVGKGDTVHVSGRLSQDKWADKETGAPRSKLKMIADKVTFLRWGRDRQAGGGGGENPPF